LGTLKKLCSEAGRAAGRAPKLAGFIGVRPAFRPDDVLKWLDSLITPEPRATGMTIKPAPTAASTTEQHLQQEPAE
jgi:hypothetical protein